jgi:hypothetical protein
MEKLEGLGELLLVEGGQVAGGGFPSMLDAGIEEGVGKCHTGRQEIPI